MKKTNIIIKQLSLLLTVLFLLTSCSSVYDHLPETTKDAESIDPEEEYFTTGHVICASSPNLGIIYEGQWIYVESTRIEKNGEIHTVAERFVKYNPVTDTVSSLCLDPTCFHSNEDCPLCAPHAWLVSNFRIFEDWMLYTYSYYWTQGNEIDTQRTYLYNLKTGESRLLHKRSKEGELLTSTTGNFVMNGKIYSGVLELDYSGQEEYESQPHKEPFEPETHQYIEAYDPETQKTERLFEVPSPFYLLVGLTNKRLFYKDSEGKTWSTDYKGENHTEEANMDFDFIMMCDQYVYLAESPDYSKAGYNFRGYDLETDSMFEIDFGCQIRSALVDSRQLCFTTLSNIDEYKVFVKNPTAYIKNLYPDITDPEKLAELRVQIRNQLQYKGNMQIYITDARGENKRLVFEKENIFFSPLRISGNYIFGIVSYADPSNSYKVTVPENKGYCVLNIETGEITSIPQLEYIANN